MSGTIFNKSFFASISKVCFLPIGRLFCIFPVSILFMGKKDTKLRQTNSLIFGVSEAILFGILPGTFLGNDGVIFMIF